MKYLILIIVLGVLSGVLLVYKSGYFKNEYKKAMIVIKNSSFEAEVADSPLKMARGLSGREQIKPDEGMLFAFGSSSVRTFWMKGMQMSIDILWIDGNKVIGIESSAAPEPGMAFSHLKRYRSPEPVQYVLEIAAGRANELGIQVGDEVDIRLE